MLTACRVCSAHLAGVPFLRFSDLRVTRCVRCGLVHLERRSESPDYFAAVLERFRTDPAGALEDGHHYLVDLVERHLPGSPGGGGERPRRLLDIGCSFGAAVHRARERGWDAHGVDTNEVATREGSRFTEGLHTGNCASQGFQPGSFSAVTMWHVLEHIPEPHRELARVAELLAPGGKLFLEVPNLESPIAWLFYRRRWLGFETPDHLFAFTTRTLVSLVRRAGLVVESVSHPVIVQEFPGGGGWWSGTKGMARRIAFGLLRRLDWGDGLRVIARKDA